MPILDANALELFTNSAEQTRRIGIQLGALLKANDVICLEGELGAGKTTLMQGIAAGWGSSDAVTSPTFVLMNVYGKGGKRQLTHMDAYRLADAAEAEALGLEDVLASGPLVVEWAEKVEAVLPAERLWIKLIWVDEERRRVEITPYGQRFEEMLAQLQETIFGVA